MSLSDWFDRAKVVTSLYREADRLYYDAVAEEMQRGIRDDGLWLMAFEKAQGDDARAQALYIGLRIRSLKDLNRISSQHTPQNNQHELLPSVGKAGEAERTKQWVDARFERWLLEHEPPLSNISPRLKNVWRRHFDYLLKAGKISG